MRVLLSVVFLSMLTVLFMIWRPSVHTNMLTHTFLIPFFAQLFDYERIFACIQQDIVSAFTANSSIEV
jgi:hypothetical protein